jgi:hypothetical protein
MTSVTGSPSRYSPALRRQALPGEIGHLGTCPLCAYSFGSPPCLACRDELRARLLEMGMTPRRAAALN